MSVRSKLNTLRRHAGRVRRVPEGECDGPPTALLQPGQSIDPREAGRCKRCGGIHPAVVTEEVVTVGAEGQR